MAHATHRPASQAMHRSHACALGKVEAPAPLILAESFCKNQAAMKSPDLSAPNEGSGRDYCTGGMLSPLIHAVFGEYIESPPLDEILGRGYAYATIYPSELAPDSRKLAPAALARIGAMSTPGTQPTGVLSVWAAAYGWVLDVLETDPRIDASRTAVWGHSRHAKAALWSAAHDSRIEAVISHQSGTGGATLSRSGNGESVAKVTGSYPHWFDPQFAAYADREGDLPVDQHLLIALAAPRPVLLGNSWNDVWSDPNGTYRAAVAADPAWQVLGHEGLAQDGMRDTHFLDAELAFQISPGAHGVRAEDWRDFLDFLDRWFAPEPLQHAGLKQ